ncbi:MAG: hypothetical protein ABFS14_10135 [Gemmatimonadota bacterium]
MKSQLALLAVPFLALACTDSQQAALLGPQSVSEPPSISADVTILASPLEGQYLHDVSPVVKKVSRFLWDVVPNTNITLKATVLFPNSDPAMKGTVVWQRCANKFGPTTSFDCQAGTARWRTISRVDVDTNGCATQGIAVSIGARHGFRYKYIGKGSGVKNGTSEEFDVRDEALNPF